MNKPDQQVDSKEKELTEELNRLRRSEERLRALIDNAVMGVYQARPDGKMLTVNRRLAEILGYENPDDLLVERPNIIDYYADPGQRSGLIEKIERNGRLLIDKLNWLDRFNRPVWIKLAARRTKTDDDKIVYEGIVEDVTVRVEAEQALIESEAAFRRLAENSPDMIYRMSLPDGRYEYVSPASVAITGYAPEEFYASTKLVKKITHPEYHDYFEKQWADLISNRAPSIYEYKIIHKDGRIKWLNQRNVVIHDERGRPTAIEGIVTDVTETKEAQHKLKQNEELFQTFMSNLPALAFIKDLSGRYLFLNRAYEDLVGIRAQDWVGEKGWQHWPKSTLAKLRATDEECISTGRPVTYFGEVSGADGEPRELMFTKFPIFDNQRLTRMGGFAFDVTEQNKTQVELRKSEHLFRSLAESSPFIVYVADENGKVIYINDRFEELTGYSKEEVPTRAAGRNLIYPDPEQRKQVSDEIDDWEREQYSALRQAERTITCKDGTKRRLIYYAKGLPDGRLLSAAVDITKIRETEAELKQAFRLKEEAQAQHLALLRGTSSHIAHLVGGFLNKLVFALTILKKENTGPAAEFSLEAIERGSMQLARFIKRFAAFGYEHKPNIESFGLAEKIEQIIDDHDDRLKAGRIEVQLTDAYPDLIRSDPDLTALAFGNIISNSIEAIEKSERVDGKIEIDVRPTGEGAVRVSIRDNGVGLAASDLDRAFEPFFSTKAEGCGLGLPITANIMKALGGDVKLRCQGPGEVFVAELDFPIVWPIGETADLPN